MHTSVRQHSCAITPIETESQQLLLLHEHVVRMLSVLRHAPQLPPCKKRRAEYLSPMVQLLHNHVLVTGSVYAAQKKKNVLLKGLGIQYAGIDKSINSMYRRYRAIASKCSITGASDRASPICVKKDLVHFRPSGLIAMVSSQGSSLVQLSIGFIYNARRARRLLKIPHNITHLLVKCPIAGQ